MLFSFFDDSLLGTVLLFFEVCLPCCSFESFDESFHTQDRVHILQISGLAKSIRTLAEMDEPVGQVLKRTEVGPFSVELCC